MSTVLYIKANAKPKGESRTFQISDAFIAAYKEKHPEDNIITLDLYKENIGFLNLDDLNSLFGQKNDESKNHPILKYAYQFLEADKYLIAEPLWNLSIPAILKAYIDYICVNGITFQYTENGPVGLCKNKKAINIVTRGGYYSEDPGASMEMGDRYLKKVFAFLGIRDFTTVSADGLDVTGNNVNAILQKAIKEATDKLDTF